MIKRKIKYFLALLDNLNFCVYGDRFYGDERPIWILYIINFFWMIFWEFFPPQEDYSGLDQN